MKYFEFNEPYYALIRANSESDAIARYYSCLIFNPYSKEIETEVDVKEVDKEYVLTLMLNVYYTQEGSYESMEERIKDLETRGLLLTDGILF